MHLTSSRVVVRCALLLAGVLAFPEGAAAVQDPIYPQAMIPASWQVTRFALVDANRDGLLDAVLGGSISAVAVSRQPYGWRDWAPLSVVAMGQIETGDFTGDGDVDVAGTTNQGPRLLAGKGDGSFGASQVVSAQNVPLIDATDADGDGDLDLIGVASGSSGNTFGLFNDGAGQFTAGPNVPVANSGVSLHAADIDADGLVDFALGRNASGGQIVLAKGLGGGTFAAWNTISAPALFDFVICSLNGDAWPDLAWSAQTSSPYAQTRLATGAGAFAPAVPVGGLPSASLTRIAAGDVDADGDDDLALVGASTTRVALTEDGVTTALPSAVFPLGIVSHVELADVDGDGRADLCTSLDGLTITRSLTPSPSFEQPISESLPPGTSIEVVSSDFDMDGDDDLVLSISPVQPAARMLPSLGDGHYGAPVDSSMSTSGRWRPRLAADVTGDGLPDAVGYHNTSSALPKDIVVMHGTGTSLLVPGAWLGLNAAVGAGGVATADVDLDGDLDLVLASTLALTLGLGDGAGGFSKLDIADPVGRVAAGDVDADGLADIVDVEFGTPGSVELRRNLGGLVFGAPEVVLPSGEPDFVELGDVDGDGRADLALTSRPGAQDHFLLLRSLPAGGWATLADIDLDNFGTVSLLPPRDVTGDGLVDMRAASEQVLACLSAGGSGGVILSHMGRLTAGAACALDADGDGTPDVAVLTGFDPISLTPVATGITTFFAHGGQSWWTLGHGLAGANGRPVLVGGGELLPGQPATLDLLNGRASSPALLVAGLQGLLLPFKSGTLVPAPDVVIALATDAEGELHLGLPWPAGLPADFDLLLQAWVQDPTAPSGFTASDALRIVQP